MSLQDKLLQSEQIMEQLEEIKKSLESELDETVTININTEYLNYLVNPYELKKTEYIPDKSETPDKIVDKISEKISDKISEKISDKISKKISEKICEKIVDGISPKIEISSIKKLSPNDSKKLLSLKDKSPDGDIKNISGKTISPFGVIRNVSSDDIKKVSPFVTKQKKSPRKVSNMANTKSDDISTFDLPIDIRSVSDNKISKKYKFNI